MISKSGWCHWARTPKRSQARRFRRTPSDQNCVSYFFTINNLPASRVCSKYLHHDVHSQSHSKPQHATITDTSDPLLRLWPTIERFTSRRMAKMLETDYGKEEVACCLATRLGPPRQSGREGSCTDQGGKKVRRSQTMLHDRTTMLPLTIQWKAANRDGPHQNCIRLDWRRLNKCRAEGIPVQLRGSAVIHPPLGQPCLM